MKDVLDLAQRLYRLKRNQNLPKYKRFMYEDLLTDLTHYKHTQVIKVAL